MTDDAYTFEPLNVTRLRKRFFDEVKDSWQCQICKRFFVSNPDELQVSCCVAHPPGTCCHYGDAETEAPWRPSTPSVETRRLAINLVLETLCLTPAMKSKYLLDAEFHATTFRMAHKIVDALEAKGLLVDEPPD